MFITTSYRPVPPPVPGGPQEPWGPSRVVREMAPGPGGSRSAGPPGAPGLPPSYWPRPRSRGPPGPPGGPRGAPRGLWGTPGLPQESQGPPGSPQEPRAPSSLPSPLPFPSLLFPFPPPVPGGPQDWVGGGGQDPPSGGPVSCLSL